VPTLKAWIEQQLARAPGGQKATWIQRWKFQEAVSLWPRELIPVPFASNKTPS
jgi:hypothetical protein